MDLFRNMRLFVRVAEDMSFTSAARSLTISIGVASRLITELEQHLQTRLLHRTTRQIALTQAGKRYLSRCRAILASIEEAEAEARAVHLQPAGRLKVHASPTIGRHYLVPAVRHYQRTYPRVQVALTLSDASSALLEDGFDTAIVALPALRDSSFVGVNLGETYSVLCAAPGYAKRDVSVDEPADLASHAFVGFGPALADAVDIALIDQHGVTVDIPVQPAFCVNTVEAVASALELGMGIGALPLHVAVDAISSGRLVRFLPDYHLQPLTVYALFPSRQYLDAKVRTWLDHLKAHFLEAARREAAVLSGTRRLTALRS
ncbi:LysR family transcriptional regulator [Paraburkholderia sp. BL10I2N1]|uniref:LysR family transcriptional regulator n=1 Tax=Paraburkholderia sp. BL10I2N1 TaxID=1938796 RepID=UPI00105D0D72|nr:LysR family transcriptional regulator [Paraburkholderia sp. BL10I2N1]TDN61104.1 DNA-binding transcriptional LysR family regulator [Paraburkholderia sp. BL10I2N1]